jgi:uncharacterized membrane protein YphA (DoxX/SURF4 family)
MGDAKSAHKAMWILLGLLMLIPGLMKLFVMGPSAVTGMLSGIALFSWAPAFWAWILILSEIVFGLLILAKYKLELTVWPPIIILAVAVLFVTINWGDLMSTSWPSVILHLIAITGYLGLGCMSKQKKK